MATSELMQAQHELATRVSNQFIAGRLANARQQDRDMRTSQQQQQQARLASSSPSPQPPVQGNVNHQHKHQATNNHSIQMPQNQSNSEKQRGDQHSQQPHHQQDHQWLQSAKHEADSDSSTASEHEPSATHKGELAGGDQNDKPHVGPMGIFFKVWSLVKVTKSRHNNRVKQRQMSEAAAGQQQFQFMSADQFGSSSVVGSQMGSQATHLGLQRGSQQQAPVQRHLLQDNHFRRAGSQPPPASHVERHGFHLGAARPAMGAGQLQIGATNTGQNTNSTTGTASSSSGVSSTTSSTLTTNHTTATDSGNGGIGGGLQVRSDPLQQNRRHYNHNNGSETSATGNHSSGRSWTTRIKRGSPGVTQPPTPASAGINNSGANSSYASRYRLQRASLDKRQSMQLAGSTTGSQSATEAKRQLRAQSEVRQLEELRRKAIAIAKSSSPAALIGGTKSKMSLQRFRQRLRQDSVSDDGGAEEEEEEEEDDDDDDNNDDDQGRQLKSASRSRQRQNEPDEEEDSDLNDIYSTPNDSIQSVPSGQLLLEQSYRRTSTGGPAGGVTSSVSNQNKNSELDGRTAASQGPYHMTKSFSANYFNQLTEADNRAGHTRAKRTIDESKVAGSTIMEVNKNSKRQPANGPRSNNGAGGSRFFISSSSSEDSNPPQQAQSATTLTSTNVTASPDGRLQSPDECRPASQQQQIPVQSGLHYHGPAASVARPSSLAVPNSAASQLLLLHPTQPSVLTPNTFIVSGPGGLEPASVMATNVAAMSPMLCGLPTMTTNLDANLEHNQHASGKLPSCQLVANAMGSGYKKSPSMFDMNSGNPLGNHSNIVQRFSSKYPWPQRTNQRQPMSSFVGGGNYNCNSNGGRPQSTRQNVTSDPRSPVRPTNNSQFCVPNSISLHDCKLESAKFKANGNGSQKVTNNQLPSEQDCPISSPRYQVPNPGASDNCITSSEYKLAQMLLELGSNPAAKDEAGYTALMHAIMSENLSAFKCVVKHGVDLNDTNHDGQSALDLICGRPANETLLEMLKLMIDNRVDLDLARKDDGSRLLDRLIREHQKPNSDKILFIDCLLHNGAKLGSSTWSAARGKHEIQLKLLRKLCQDGYFLYKKSCIEAAVFRFEYALKRIDELEQQILSRCRQSCWAKCHGPALDLEQQQAIIKETQQAKYQTFLGLSRCERKRGFFKRALEFADMSILIDSTSYEGYYSKAHILKDIGEKDDAILTIDQTERLVSKSIEAIKEELIQLDVQEESLVFDGCFNMHDPNKSSWIEATRLELNSNLDYLTEAKRHILRLRGEIVNDELS